MNDAPALREAALGIAVLGPEGTATATLAAADIVCRSVLNALDMLSTPGSYRPPSVRDDLEERSPHESRFAR
jgi:hypothetical protein